MREKAEIASGVADTRGWANCYANLAASYKHRNRHVAFMRWSVRKQLVDT